MACPAQHGWRQIVAATADFCRFSRWG